MIVGGLVTERTRETIKGWRVTKKTHASSPSTSGKTHEKTCPIETRLETRESLCLPFLSLTSSLSPTNHAPRTSLIGWWRLRGAGDKR